MSEGGRMMLRADFDVLLLRSRKEKTRWAADLGVRKRAPTQEREGTEDILAPPGKKKPLFVHLRRMGRWKKKNQSIYKAGEGKGKRSFSNRELS